MSDDPLGRRATTARLEALHRQGAVDIEALRRAVERASATPDSEAWRAFLSLLLLLTGAALTLSGLVYLVAFNWSELHRFAQFGLCGAWILAGAGLAAWRLPDTVGKVGLLGASVGVGALLASIGQAYQTGADAWGLFATWAVLVLPWTLVARMPAHVVLLVVLLDVTLATWGVQVAPELGSVRWLLFAGINGAASLLWAPAARRWPELASGWAPRVLAAACFVGLVVASVPTAYEASWALTDGGTWAALVLVGVSVALGVQAQRTERPDLFAATLAAVGVLVVLNTAVGRVLMDDLDLEEFGFFVLSILVVVQAAAFVAWAIRQRPRHEEDA